MLRLLRATAGSIVAFEVRLSAIFDPPATAGGSVFVPLCDGFRVLLGIAAELIRALLRAEVIIFAVVIHLGCGVLLIDPHVANRISLHSILRTDWKGSREQ